MIEPGSFIAHLTTKSGLCFYVTSRGSWTAEIAHAHHFDSKLAARKRIQNVWRAPGDTVAIEVAP